MILIVIFFSIFEKKNWEGGSGMNILDPPTTDTTFFIIVTTVGFCELLLPMVYKNMMSGTYTFQIFPCPK